MDSEDVPESAPPTPSTAHKSAKPRSSKRKKGRRRKKSPHSPRPSDEATSAQASETPTDVSKARPSPAAAAEKTPTKLQLPPAKAKKAVSIEEVGQEDSDLLDGDVKPEDAQYDSHVGLREAPQEPSRQPTVPGEPANRVPRFRFSRKIIRRPRDSLDHIRPPSRKKKTGAATKVEGSAACAPEKKGGQVLRFDGSEDGNVERVPASRAQQTPSAFPGARRKSSVRFGHATYREIEQHSESSNIEPAPKRFAPAISAFMVVCICIILFVIYAFSPRVKEKLAQACSTRACEDAMMYLANVTDDRVDPCADFYGHVCGPWISNRDAGASFIRDAIASFWRNANKTLLEAAEVPADRHGTHVFRSFYKSCYNFMDNRSPSTGSPHVVFVSNFGTLQVFLGKPYPSVLTTLVRISISYGLDSIFKVRLVEDKLYSKLMVTQTTSIRRKFGDDATLKTVDSYLLEFLREASSSHFPFQDYHQKVLSLDDEVRNIFNVDSRVQKEMHFEDIEHLTKHLTARTWMDTVNAVLPAEHKVSLEARIKARDFDATRQVFDVLDQKNDHTLRTVYLYVQLASDVLRLDHHRRYANNSEDTVHVCLEESQKVLTRTWSYVFASVSRVFPRDITIETLYSLVSDAVVSLDRAKWMDGDTRREAMDVLKHVTLTYFPTVSNVVLPSSMSYANITMSKTDFLSDYISLLGKEQSVLLKFPTSAEQDRLNRLQLDGPLSYLKHVGSVLVPTAYGLPPVYYSSALPMYFDMATLGVLIAKELSDVIGPLAGSTWWSAAAKTGFNVYFQCLAKILRKLYPAHNVDESKLANSVFVWTRSLRVVYNLVRTELADLKKHGVRDAERVFFKRFCLLSCSSSQDPRPLTPWQQCMLPLFNMQEFLDAYHCSQDVGADVRECELQ